MSNTMLSPTIITRRAIVNFINELQIAKKIHRDVEAVFRADKPGTTVTVRKPNRFTVRTGEVMDVQDISEPSVIVTLATFKGVDMKFTESELVLVIDEFTERYIRPACVAIANVVDAALFALYSDVSGWVGTAATTPSTYATSVQLVNQYASEMGWPNDGDRHLALNPAAYAAVVASQVNFFQEAYAKRALAQGEQKQPFGGWDVFESANVAAHLVGTYGGTTLTEGAGADADAVTDTDGWSSGASNLTVGDVFTIADVYAVNPHNRASTGRLKTFAVTTAISDTAGDIDIAHTPAIKSTGAFQNVNSAPANDKAIVVKTGATGATNPQNLAFHKDAFCLAMAEMDMPVGVWGDRQSYQGFSVRVLRGYDINTNQRPCRLDVLYGVKTLEEALACRLSG